MFSFLLLSEHLKTTVILCGFRPMGFGCVFRGLLPVKGLLALANLNPALPSAAFCSTGRNSMPKNNKKHRQKRETACVAFLCVCVCVNCI